MRKVGGTMSNSRKNMYIIGAMRIKRHPQQSFNHGSHIYCNIDPITEILHEVFFWIMIVFEDNSSFHQP